MRVRNEITYPVLLLLNLIEISEQLKQCPAADTKIVHFDKVRPITSTPVFCAVTTGAQATQTLDTDVRECSRQCAHSDDCLGFNHVEPQFACVQFYTPFSTLFRTHGCTHYEVSRIEQSQCLR